jgi:Ca2+-binding RTX toxin-like protein
MAVLVVTRNPLASGFIGIVTVATSTHIQIVAGTVTQNYFGFGFAYSNDAQVIGGTITSTELFDSSNGGLQYRITGLSHSAVTAYNLINSGGNISAFFLNGTDTITGSVGSDALWGYAGSDNISAGEGNDALYGYGDAAADTLAGGAGDDTYYIDGTVSGATDSIVEAANGGIDVVVSYGSFTLPSEVEILQLQGTQSSSGTGNSLNNTLTGNDRNNVLDGGSGNDTLYGGVGLDTLIGGLGDDRFIMDSTQDVIVELVGGGTDRIESSVSLTLPDNVEELWLVGTSPLEAIGNSLPNRLVGNAGDNFLSGGGGADTLEGGAGNDTYLIDDMLDTIIDTSGIDSVMIAINEYVLPTGDIEGLTLIGSALVGSGNAFNNVITGNPLNNTLFGLDGNDTLAGGGGLDTLVGGSGDDTYVVGNISDVVVELSSGGTDLVQSSVTFTLPENVENLQLVGGQADISGIGNGGVNQIFGNDGANVLNGGGGADLLNGGEGSDTYYVNNGGVTVVDLGLQGTDKIIATISFDLGVAPGVENLQLNGTGDLNATGNSLHNVIVGNAGKNTLIAVGPAQLFGGEGSDSLIGGDFNDVLDGGAGADVMTGGYGWDTYVVDHVGDIINENADSSSQYLDVVNSWVSYALPVGVEYLYLQGDLPINASANDIGTLIGNNANNTLTGGRDMQGLGGNDTLISSGAYTLMIGGLGNDTYYVSSSEQIRELANEGSDTVIASWNWSLSDDLENLTLVSGQFAIGNSVDNVIIGNSSDNFIDGKGGADRMEGGAGDDNYRVDHHGDVVVETASGGNDSVTVESAISFSIADTAIERLSFNVDNPNNLSLSAIGNELDNVIFAVAAGYSVFGGAGNDTLYGVRLFGESGMDDLNGGPGDDYLDGGDDADLLKGEGGSDLIFGGGGNDRLVGGGGDDALDGGAGDDFLDASGWQWGQNYLHGKSVITGGSGADLFIYGGSQGYFGDNLAIPGFAYSSVAQPDRITDFSAAEGDVIYSGLYDGQSGGLSNKRLIWFGQADAEFTAELGQATSLAGDTGDQRFRGFWMTYDALNNITVLYMDRDDDGFVSLNDLRLEFDGNVPLDVGSFSPGTITFLVGTSGDDSDTLSPLGENSDVAFGLLGNDDLNGLTGDDRLSGDGGNDHLQGDVGDDRLFGGEDDDLLEGGSGDDRIYGGTGSDTMHGGDGSDEIWADGFQDDLTYQWNYVYDVSENQNNLYGDAGDDFLLGGPGADQLYGGDDNDVIYAGDGNDLIEGGSGHDLLSGGSGDDLIKGGSGSDIVRYFGMKSDFTVTWSANGVTVTDANGFEGTDTLIGVENLTFSDGIQRLEIPATLQAYSWKAHTLLNGVTVAASYSSGVSDTSGVAVVALVPEQDTSVTIGRTVPTSEAALTSQAVNLQDAIAVLKMIVGLDINGTATPVSPYQRFAADFDGNGTVGLTDAIAILKHVVGLPSPTPGWIFFDQFDPLIPTVSGLTPGTVANTVSVPENLDHFQASLIGVLRGDVDGSFVGAPGAVDLDVVQPSYFTNLLASHGLPMAQFGIYS